jgi:iron complex transport system ATP-binding protein
MELAMEGVRPLLEIDGLACGHGNRCVVKGVSLSLDPGQVLCLLGPNGSGKTTLFKTFLKLIPAQAGRILIDGNDTAGWSERRFARVVGYVPQAHDAPFSYLVRDVVAMGRVSHLGAFASPSQADAAIAEAALDTLSILHLAGRSYSAISGGERQLTLIARALAQQPRLLVLDEPTSNLDYGNQVTVLEHVRALADSRKMAVVMTTHDPNQALAYATLTATIDRHGGFARGRPEEVVTAKYLSATYGVRARILDVDGYGRICLSLGREATPSCAS